MDLRLDFLNFEPCNSGIPITVKLSASIALVRIQGTLNLILHYKKCIINISNEQEINI